MTIRGEVFLTITLSTLVLGPPVYAHPGNTASDGCHYCRTNCDKWGEAWDERHCHSGGAQLPPITTKKSTPLPTKMIASSPTPSPSSNTAPVLSPTPDSEGEVLGVTKESSPTPTNEPANVPVTIPANSEDSGLGVIIITLAALVAGGGAYTIYRRKKVV